MQYMSRQKLDSLTDHELLAYVNIYLRNHSLNKFEDYHKGSPKGYIKHRLKRINAHYYSDDKQFYVDTTTDTEQLPTDIITEVLPKVSEQYQPATTENQVFHDIKNILEVMSLHMTSLCDDVAIIKDNIEVLPEVSPEAGETRSATVNQVTSIDDLRPLKTDEDYITRAMKIYPSHMKRIKKLTKDSQLQQQQIVAILLDKALKDLGY